MLKKLLKYDLLWSYKLIVIYHLLGVIFAVMGKLSETLPDTTFFIVLTGIFKGCALSCLIPGLVNSIIRSWVRLINNMYKDEAHLTHTIPVDIRMHYLSKVLSGIILVTVSTLFLLGGVALMYLNKNSIVVIKEYLNILSTTMNGSFGVLIVLLAVVLILEVLLITLIGYFGIIWGYSFNNHKLILSIAFGIVFHFVCNMFTLIVILISGLFNNAFYKMLFEQNAALDYNVILMIAIMSIVLYSLYTILAYVISNVKLKKGVNID